MAARCCCSIVVGSCGLLAIGDTWSTSPLPAYLPVALHRSPSNPTLQAQSTQLHSDFIGGVGWQEQAHNRRALRFGELTTATAAATTSTSTRASASCVLSLTRELTKQQHAHGNVTNAD